MKKMFKEMEERVTVQDIALRSGEIERKNLLLANENLITRCVAQDVYFTATDSTINACQFQTFSNALCVTQNRVIELEGENSRLLEKIQKDDHDNMVKHFSKLEVENIDLQLKVQHLEEKLKKTKQSAIME